MKYGILSLYHSRRITTCKHCSKEIGKGEEYFGQTFMGKVPWTIKIHIGCLYDWCKANAESRKLARLELANDPMSGVEIRGQGRPPVEANSDQLRERKKIQFYLHSCKEYLLKAYSQNDSARIQASWQRYAKWLEAYGDEELVGSTAKYRFGDAITRVLTDVDIELRDKLAICDGNPLELAAVLHGVYGRKTERKPAVSPSNEDIVRSMVEREHVTK